MMTPCVALPRSKRRLAQSRHESVFLAGSRHSLRSRSTARRAQEMFLTRCGRSRSCRGAGRPAQAGAGPAPEPPPPIYDEKLLRLSEILGSLAFLRDLCGEPRSPPGGTR